MSKITPISGFPEYLPAQQLAFADIVGKIRAVYESFGYVPLETPAVERINTLVSKGIDAKEVYALRRLNADGDDDGGAKELALKFDLTVPLARYVSLHYANLVFPFRRYQVQPVWRGERAQKGRYRQFYQFDIDYIGENTLPLAADAEILAAAWQALTTLGLTFRMRVNNRLYLQSAIQAAGMKNTAAAIKLIDNLEKVGADATVKAFTDQNLCDAATATRLLADLSEGRINPNLPGAEDLETVLTLAKELTGAHNIAADLTIARGLDYYTGTVMETVLEGAPELGSICSGGRYENLAESLSERKLPGVGISIGLSRLFAWLADQPQYAGTPATTAQVFIPLVSADDLPRNAQAAARLRAAGVAVEQSLAVQQIGTQLQKAEKRGLNYAVFPQADGSLTLRPFATRKDEPGLTAAQVAAKILK